MIQPRSVLVRLLLGRDIAEMLRGYTPPRGKHNSLITGSPTDWTWGKGDHGSELDGLGDDDHTQYLNTTRHDVTARHPAAVIGNLPTSKITSGRFPVSRLPALSDEKIWKGTGGNVEEVDLPGGVYVYSVNCQATDIPNNSEVRFLRFTIPSGKTLKIKAASVYPSGVGNHIVEVYNLTDTISLYSTNSSWVAGDLASLAGEKEVCFRVNNTSGSEQTGSIGFIAFVVE